jgi:hypothetical protein
MPPPSPLHTPLPEGIAIRPAAPEGVSLITTRAFDAGTLLFQGEATLITTAPTDPNSDPYATLTVNDTAGDGCVVGVYPIRLHQHTTRLPGSPSRRLLHAGLGSLINHGCDPSTVVEAMGDMGEEDREGAAAGGSVLVRASMIVARVDRPAAFEFICDRPKLKRRST